MDRKKSLLELKGTPYFFNWENNTYKVFYAPWKQEMACIPDSCCTSVFVGVIVDALNFYFHNQSGGSERPLSTPFMYDALKNIAPFLSHLPNTKEANDAIGAVSRAIALAEQE